MCLPQTSHPNGFRRVVTQIYVELIKGTVRRDGSGINLVHLIGRH
jgi:hypothetical protein